MPKYLPRNMLITGGAGFIGTNFIRHLLSQDNSIKIFNLDKLTYAGSLDNLKNLPNLDRYTFIHGDIIDTNLITQVLETYQIDTIVHFAAESHVDRSIDSPADFITTNLVGTFVLLETAKNYWLTTHQLSATKCRFHHISTDEVFGSLAVTDPLSNEATAYSPRSPYSASKAGSDHLVKAYYHTYGLPITLSNCSNNFGPYQHNEKFIPTVIRACLEKKPIPIYGNGKNIRDWLYVEDHCKGILEILQRGTIGESYNLGANNEWENLNLAKFICQQMTGILPEKFNYEKLISFVTDRPGHDFRYAINSQKIKTELNWQPSETMQTGMEKTIQFYCKQFQGFTEMNKLKPQLLAH